MITAKSFPNPLTALASIRISRSRPTPRTGRTTIRPGQGLRLIAPGALMLALAGLGMASRGSGAVLVYLAAIVLALVWSNLAFRHRVTWSGDEIIFFAMNLKQHARRLSALTDIRPHDTRDGFELTFAGRKPLFVPSYLAQRGGFLTAMQDIVHDNTNNGAIVPMAQLRSRLKG